MLKHFVEFLYPGIFFVDRSFQEISKRKDELVSIPKDAFAYRFYDKEQTIINGRKHTGKCKNYSGFTFIGTAYTVEEITKQFPKQTILISNLKSNGYKMAVLTCKGNWQGLRKKDRVINN